MRAALGADLIFTQNAPLDQEFDEVIVGSQRVEELLEVLEERGGGRRPLVVTSMDRIDIVLGLLAAQVGGCWGSVLVACRRPSHPGGMKLSASLRCWVLIAAHLCGSETGCIQVVCWRLVMEAVGCHVMMEAVGCHVIPAGCRLSPPDLAMSPWLCPGRRCLCRAPPLRASC